MPRSGELSLAEVARSIPQSYKDAFYAAQRQELSSLLTTPAQRQEILDNIYNTSGIRAFIENAVKRYVESKRYSSIRVDLEHSNSVITISADESASRLLGKPHYVPHAGTQSDFSLKYNPSDNPNSYDIRSIHAEHVGNGVLFINGIRVAKLHIESSFSGTITITNCYVGTFQLDTNTSSNKPHLHIQATKIAKMTLNVVCCGSMSLRNVYLWRIDFNPADNRSLISHMA